MKRIVIFILLVVLAGVAGVVVRSSSGRGTVSEIRGLVSQNASGDARDEIRQTFELAPGARVEVGGINGPVTIETADTTTAEVYIERTASSEEALSRRKITVEGSGDKLRIRGETTEHKFLARLFGSKASEKITLKLPRRISLFAKGVNGAVVVGEISGSIEISGINGKVQVANAAGNATLKGINGSVMVGLKSVVSSGIEMSGINGNIELQLPTDLNAYFEARGMNGRVIADYPNVSIDKGKHGNYSGRIGSGGAEISAKGINGNIRLTPAGGSTGQAAESRGN